MSKRSMPMILAVILIVAGAAPSNSSAAATPAGWHTYRNRDYGFTINYPGDGSFTHGYQIAPLRPRFSVCDATSATCFQYNGHTFEGTIIDSLKISVNILRDRRTEAECSDINQQPFTTVVIHRTHFHFAQTLRRAGDTSAIIDVYRTFHRHVCFEIALVTSRLDHGAEEYEEYGLHPLNECALRAVRGEMDRMLRSFRFTNRHSGDAASTPYHRSGCVDQFEVPADLAGR